MASQRTVLGIRIEQPNQPTWLVAVNKLWVTSIAKWHRLVVHGSFPREGPVLLVANHADAMDPMIVAEAVTRVGGRTLTMLTRAEFFTLPLIGWWLRKTGGIPIRRDEADLGALRSAVLELRHGHVVGAFPQATRAFGMRGEFGTIKSGAAYLAARTGAPVVPAAILGTCAPLWSRRRYAVRFGPAFVVPPLPRRPSQADLDQRTQLIEQQMLALLPPSYRLDRPTSPE
jgi:1-acyl-sn-glycerol-3-phosphate acyltransferase